MKLDDFTHGYIDAMFWVQGEQFDNLDLYDIDYHDLEALKIECEAFQRDHEHDLSHAGTDEQNGRDYYLTRNGHGTGYWDRGYHETTANRLTKAANAAGETWEYLGDYGMVYL